MPKFVVVIQAVVSAFLLIRALWILDAGGKTPASAPVLLRELLELAVCSATAPLLAYSLSHISEFYKYFWYCTALISAFPILNTVLFLLSFIVERYSYRGS